MSLQHISSPFSPLHLQVLELIRHSLTPLHLGSDKSQRGQRFIKPFVCHLILHLSMFFMYFEQFEQYRFSKKLFHSDLKYIILKLYLVSCFIFPFWYYSSIFHNLYSHPLSFIFLYIRLHWLNCENFSLLCYCEHWFSVMKQFTFCKCVVGVCVCEIISYKDLPRMHHPLSPF